MEQQEAELPDAEVDAPEPEADAAAVEAAVGAAAPEPAGEQYVVRPTRLLHHGPVRLGWHAPWDPLLAQLCRVPRAGTALHVLCRWGAQHGAKRPLLHHPMSMQGSTPDAEALLQGPKDPASYSLNFLWLDKNVAVSVDQVFSKVRRRVCRLLSTVHVPARAL